MSRTQFDPLSLLSVRRDALLQYANTNQSEPLRILLFALLAAIFALVPLVSVEVPSAISPFIEGVPARVACAAGALGSAALFNRERGMRTAQLLRLEREYALRELPVMLDGWGRVVSVRELQGGQQGSRAAILLLGQESSLRRQIETLRELAPRLAEAAVVLVAVPISELADASARDATSSSGRIAASGLKADGPTPWLATAASLSAWEAWVDSMMLPAAKLRASGGWIAFTRRGRTSGSGLGELSADQLLNIVTKIGQ